MNDTNLNDKLDHVAEQDAIRSTPTYNRGIAVAQVLCTACNTAMPVQAVVPSIIEAHQLALQVHTAMVAQTKALCGSPTFVIISNVAYIDKRSIKGGL